MSEKYLLVKGYYDSGLWTITRVQYAVYMGWITEAEFVTITGEPYTPPPAPPSPTPVVAEENDVTFIDYDGTIVYSYTSQEFLALTEMPANPAHEGLTSQGWNWSLSDAQDYVEDYGTLVIGQMYITDDGKTRIYLELGERLSVRLYIRVNGTVDIDWGDETAHTIRTNSTMQDVNADHTYSSKGNYTISLDINGQCTLVERFIRNPRGTNIDYDKVYMNTIKCVNIGNSLSLGSSCFNQCYSVEVVTLPNSILDLPSSCFTACYSLKSMTIPDNNTSNISIGGNCFNGCCGLSSISLSNRVYTIGTGCFYNCNVLEKINIPTKVTGLQAQWCYACLALRQIVIPENVTTLAGIFYNNPAMGSITFPTSITSIPGSFLSSTSCVGLAYIKFKASTPPVLEASNSLGGTNLPPDCKIYVPQGSLSDYTSATNYPSSSTYTYIEY